MLVLFRALSAELLKLKRTLALWMMLITPLTIVALQVFIILRLSSASTETAVNGWEFLIRNSFGFWVVLMLPLFVALEVALVGGIEHGQKMWKHLFALPIPRWAIYAAKHIVILMLLAGSMIILLTGIAVVGYTLQGLHLRSDLQWTAPNPSWSTALISAALIFALSWLMVALHMYVAIRWSSFILTLTIGVVATIISFLVVNNPLIAQVFPWSLPFNGFTLYATNQAPVALPLLLSCAGGVMVAILGAWDTTRRDIF